MSRPFLDWSPLATYADEAVTVVAVSSTRIRVVATVTDVTDRAAGHRALNVAQRSLDVAQSGASRWRQMAGGIDDLRAVAGGRSVTSLREPWVRLPNHADRVRWTAHLATT
jgi:hypothetical protein